MGAAERVYPGVKKLVLGFDRGCGTCLELAQRIDERLGEKLEVQNLRDPQVEGWRKRTLGQNAPWAPTLFEVDGEKVRAWTGWRMGFALTRFLGPADTWKVMQILGEMNAPLENRSEASPVAKAVGGLTRGQFLKGVGGATVAMSVLSTTGRLASPLSAAESSKSTKLSGSDLERVARSLAGRKDVINVMGRKWSSSFRRGSRIISSCQNGDCVVVIGSGNGSCSVRRVNGKLSYSGNCVAVRARRHTLRDGNKLIAVSYAMNQTDRVMTFYEFERPSRRGGGRLKSEARVFSIKGKKALVRSVSANGKSARLASSTTFEAQSSCTCTSTGTYPTKYCAEVDVLCFGLECGGCFYFTRSDIRGIMACAAIVCPLVLFSTGLAGCCYRLADTCYPCYTT